MQWSSFIMRNVNTQNFPFPARTVLPIDYECIFYADRDRWSHKAE
jgi:hypothetical protein